MTVVLPPKSRRLAPLRAGATVALVLHLISNASAQQPQTRSSAPSAEQSREAGPTSRIPRQQAFVTAALDGVVREQLSESAARPIPAAKIQLRELATGNVITTFTAGDGAFRISLLVPGAYQASVEADGYAALQIVSVALNANEVLTLEIFLVSSANVASRSRLPRQPELGPPLPGESAATVGSYREFRHRLDSDPNYILELAPDVLPPSAQVFSPVPDRWVLPQPDYRRYPLAGETIYAKSHWYDPFNRNRFKGDEPIWPELFGQQVFFDFTGSAKTFLDGRRVPTPTAVSPAQPGSSGFFGNGDQFQLDQTFRFSFDLFHGDASFKPVDWRIRVTPELSLNYLNVQELGVVQSRCPEWNCTLRLASRIPGSIR